MKKVESVATLCSKKEKLWRESQLSYYRRGGSQPAARVTLKQRRKKPLEWIFFSLVEENVFKEKCVLKTLESLLRYLASASAAAHQQLEKNSWTVQFDVLRGVDACCRSFILRGTKCLSVSLLFPIERHAELISLLNELFFLWGLESERTISSPFF